MTDITLSRATVEQALEALEFFRDTAICTADTDTANEAITALRAALAEPTLTQQMTDAGFTPRDNRLTCDECGGKFTRQMLPIHKCAALAEPALTVPSDCTDSHQPVGWFEGPFGEFRANPLHRIAWPAQTVAWSIPLFLAPPQRLPLTDEEIDAEWRKATSEEGFTTAQFVRNFVRAIERAHGIGDKDGPQG